MVATTLLWQMVEAENIHVAWLRMNDDGLYVAHPELPAPCIALKKGLEKNERLLRTVLSHELGHHFTIGVRICVAAERLRKQGAGQSEYRARKWAVNCLVPRTELLELARTYTIDALADIFFVTEEYIRFQLFELSRGHGFGHVW